VKLQSKVYDDNEDDVIWKFKQVYLEWQKIYVNQTYKPELFFTAQQILQFPHFCLKCLDCFLVWNSGNIQTAENNARYCGITSTGSSESFQQYFHTQFLFNWPFFQN